MMICFQGGWAQSLMHSKPLDYNTGFAGSKKFDRVSFHFNEIGKNSNNSYFSYDRLVKPLKGGIGFYGNNRSISFTENINKRILEIEYNSKQIGAVYSPKFIFKNSILISPSVSLGYAHFEEQKSHLLDETNSILISKNRFGFFNSKVGILANSKNSYFGYTLNSQFATENYILQSFQAGYVFNLDKKVNILLDGKYNLGSQVNDYWRNYKSQLNLAYQYGVLFVGAGLNDQKYVSGLIGLKLINLKINAAYHILKPQNISNVELGIQYVFDKNNDEKINLPFRKWLLKLRM